MSMIKHSFGFFIKENKLEEALKVFDVFGAKITKIELIHAEFENYWRITVRTNKKDFNRIARQIHRRYLHLCDDEKVA